MNVLSRVGLAAWLVILAMASIAAPAWAQGGPPLITDDPDTPGPGYWEINLLTSMETTNGERVADFPRLDMNYGVGERIQLKFEIPYLVSHDRETDENVSGLGNGELGVKWRFLGKEGQKLAWSIYPQLEFNTAHSSVTEELVGPGHEALLPTEFTIEWTHLELNGEVGRILLEHGDGGWVEGLSTEAEVSPTLELLGEVHGEHEGEEPSVVMANVGARWKATPQVTVMAAVGRSLENSAGATTRLLFGLQANLPGLYSFK